jgi:hypothetical protein
MYLKEELKCKYIAVKLKGFRYYVWFDNNNVEFKPTGFIGRGGWGKDGSMTNVECEYSQIEGYIHSEDLQYV